MCWKVGFIIRGGFGINSASEFGSVNRFFKFHGYHAARMIDSASRHEPYLIPVIERLLKAHPGPFLNVGVNVGQTLAKGLSIDCDRKYIGFEPQIACCYEVTALRALISFTMCSSCQLHFRMQMAWPVFFLPASSMKRQQCAATRARRVASLWSHMWSQGSVTRS